MIAQDKNCEACFNSTIQQSIPIGDCDIPEASSVQNFKDNTFPTFLLCGLNHLRQQENLCDVMLVTGQDEHPAHKSVLAAISSYFRAMFSQHTGFLEAAQLRIPLKDISSNVMKQIINYIYSGEIEITEENVGDLMIAADFLHIKPVLNQCCHYLHSRINNSNCISIYLSAKACNCSELANAAKRHVLENFHYVVQEEEYLNLPFRELQAFLRSDLLNTSGDGELLEIIRNWVDYEPPERLQHVKPLVNELHSNPLQSYSGLTDITSNNPNVKMAIEEALLQTCGSPISTTSPNRYKQSRHGTEEEVIIAIGGESHSYVFNSMECYARGYDSWKCSIPKVATKLGIGPPAQVMPPMKTHRSFAAVCSTDYNVFVVGKLETVDLLFLEETLLSSIAYNQMSTLASLPMAVHGSGAAYPNKVLCIVGGRSHQQIEKRCWAYEEKCNIWKSLPAMECGRVHHGVASLNSTLYALGGLGGKQTKHEIFLSSVERYCPSLQNWFTVAPMIEARAFFGVAVVGMYLYAIGGYNGTSWLRSVERYDPFANQWITMTPMSAPRSSFGVAVVGGLIYVMGGTDGIHLLSSVEKFNPLTNRWHCSQAMKTCRFGLGAGMVRIPAIS